MSYLEPEIIFAKRSYVKCYIQGNRERFYNGKGLGIKCFPNKAKSPEAKLRELERLKYQLKKKLAAGWRPMRGVAVITPKKVVGSESS
jgi:hypothetical protein